MKKFLKLLILTICILMTSIPVFASDLITSAYDTMLIGDDLYDTSIANDSILVQLNGDVVDFTDSEGNKVDPQIINDRTMVPMRKIFEVLGANIEWNGETRSVKATTEELEIGLQIDNKTATVKNTSGDVTEIELDSAPVIIDGRTLVPVRFIAESLDKKVGWDAYNRAVIIIDTTFVEEILKEKTSNFYEYVTTDFEKIDTYEMEVDVLGKVNYVDKEDKKNNTTLNINGNMDLKLAKEAMGIDLDLNLTGKGVLIETIKEQKYDEISLDVILDLANNALYLKLNLDGENTDTWIKYDIEEADEIKTILEMARKQESGIKALVDVLLPENELTVSSYSEAQTTMQLLAMLMSNENFKVSGRTSKTYTYKLDLSEIVEWIMSFVGEGAEYEDESLKFDLALDVKVADKVAKESNCTFNMEISEAEESIKLSVEAKGKLKSYNENVIIKMPKAEDVIVPYAE